VIGLEIYRDDLDEWEFEFAAIGACSYRAGCLRRAGRLRAEVADRQPECMSEPYSRDEIFAILAPLEWR
jgi:hypothetical protein